MCDFCKRIWKKKRSVFSFFSLLFLAVVLVGCGVNNNGLIASAESTPAPSQVLTFPDVGVTDITSLDPALGFDMNSSIIMNMLYSGLLRLDNNSQAVADQATWEISPDGKVYTFMLKPGLTFSDGTPVTAASYIYTWTRALTLDQDSSFALSLE